MKNLKNIVIFVISGSFINFVLTTMQPVYSGELDFNDEQNAKVSRFKAKGRVIKNRSDGDLFPQDLEGDNLPGLDEEDKCGVIDIGNVTNDKPFGTPKQVDIIITGDVINAGNNCK